VGMVDDMHHIWNWKSEYCSRKTLHIDFVTMLSKYLPHPAVKTSLNVHWIVSQNGTIIRGGIGTEDVVTSMDSSLNSFFKTSVFESCPDQGKLFFLRIFGYLQCLQ
jgi:hypothetical protein